ncbi:MAG: hypothetical protein NT062_37085, partial [Proteobacteria bacterium]|nr:hypothetical protein [Pseudomonadota bacterium]
MRRALLVALLAACGGDDAPAVDAPASIDALSADTVVYVVRHAETAGAGSDPQLSPAGLAR